MLASQSDRAIIEDMIIQKYHQNCFRDKKVVIFGCTLFARDIRDVLRKNGIELFAMIDNNKDKTEKLCLGVEVYLPEIFFKKHKKDIVVIICSKYSYEMQKQLVKLGLDEENIVNIPVSESHKTFDDSEAGMEEMYAQVLEGCTIYEKIKAAYPENYHMFLCPYPGTGDIYMACTYIKEYCVRHGINDYIFVVVGGSCKRTAELFGIKNIEVITEQEKARILQAWQFAGDGKLPLKPLLYWGWRVKRYLYSDKYPQITFNEMFLYDAFGLDKSARKALPNKNTSGDYAKELFEKNKLTPGKTVILAPYAGSFVSEMGIEKWNRVAKILMEKGYDVCTNCNGDSEKPVEGTTPVFFPYKEALSVLEYAGGFIGLRSGLCDIVSSADCKLIIIYENGFNAARYEYFSIKRMGLNDNAIEFIYDSDTIVDEIVRAYIA